MDHAATTPLDERVLNAMLPWLSVDFGNPSALYEEGRRAKRGIESARRQVAGVLGADKNEIYFTAGGSESDNWAVKGLALSCAPRGRHIITSAIEHHAVLHTCAFLERHGWKVTYLMPDRQGILQPESVEKAIRTDTVLVSVMAANNEIGTIQPLAEIGEVTSQRGILFHTDAVQAFGHMPLDVRKMKIDALSMSGHKIYGPKGIGGLYLKKGIKIENFIHGGAQERKKRAGTENVPAIVGLGRAAELIESERAQYALRITALREHLIDGILSSMKGVVLTGDRKKRLPGNIHLIIEGIDSNALLMRLDMAGISASSGSACTAGSVKPSHVLAAIGRPLSERDASLRLSLGRSTTAEEVDRVVDALKEIVEDLRK